MCNDWFLYPFLYIFGYCFYYFSADLLLRKKEDLIVDFLRLTINKYCDVNELRIPDYFKMRSEVLNQTGKNCWRLHIYLFVLISVTKNYCDVFVM